MKSKHSRDLSRRPRRLSSFIGALVALGCASTPSRTTAPPHSAANHSTLKSPEVVARTVVTPEATTDIPELFAQATAAGKAEQYVVAAQAFERAFDLDPSGPLADKSLFEPQKCTTSPDRTKRLWCATSRSLAVFPIQSWIA